MLRVLTLSTLFPDASRPNFGVFVERQTLGLAALRDTHVTVVAPIGLPPGPNLGRYASLGALPSHEVWKGLSVARPRFVALPFTQGRFHARAMVRALAPLLDRLKFDVIDASFFFPDGPAAVALGKRYGVPVSIKARGADIHHWGRASATRAQVLAAGVQADGLLAVSGAMADDMMTLGLPRPRVHHTGVDHARFGSIDRSVARAALAIAGPVVLSLGALIPRKGHDIVIDAVARLPGVTLLIAGEGPERARLTAQVAASGAGERIRLLGSVAHGELPMLISAADVMALASSSEGLANAWVEALAAGTPIVITDAGGAREVLRDDAAGRVAARNAGAFANAIAAVLRDPPTARSVRAAAAGFSWEANALALRDHLAGLVAARQPIG